MPGWYGPTRCTGQGCCKEIVDLPGQRVVMRLGESRSMPLPHVGLPEDSLTDGKLPLRLVIGMD
jgi:hypothetical protein